MRTLKILGQGLDFREVCLWKKDIKLPEAPAPIQPTAPVEEVGIELDDNEKKRKDKTGKSTLKVPTKTSDNVGLNGGNF